MDFFKKVQNLDLVYRKFIFWLIIIILAIGLSILFLKRSKRRMENTNSSNFLEESGFPDFGKELNEAWPKESQEKIKQTIEEVDEAIKEGQEEQKQEE